MNRCLVFAISLLILPLPAPWHAAADPVPATAPSDAQAAHHVLKRDEFAIALPAGWQPAEGMGGPVMKLYCAGGGNGVPLVDEHGSPLQIGLTVKYLPGARGTLEEGARQLIAAAQHDSRLELIGEPKTEKVTLSDGGEALLLTTEFVKDGRRRSLQRKLLVKDADDKAWIISTFIVGSKQSQLPQADSPLAKWLQSFGNSFVFDAEKLDESKLPGPYNPQPMKNKDQEQS